MGTGRFEPTLAQIATALGGDLVLAANQGADTVIHGIASLEDAQCGDISFLANARYARLLRASAASCIILRAEEADRLGQEPCNFAQLVTPDPYLYYARLSQWWSQQQRGAASADQTRIHPSAVVDPSARIGEGVEIGALCAIEAGVAIGAGSKIAARVVIGAGCQVGKRCIVHSGAVIGADGFGFALDNANGQWVKIVQLGAVVIGNDVEIGANTCIDRGALSNTVIEDGVKLDNLVQIGHNCRVGRHTAMAGCVGVAGSTVIGAHCTLGGAAVVLGHLELADRVHISAASVVTRSIRKAGTYSGIFPLDENTSWEKNAVTLRQLHQLRERIRALEKAVGEGAR